MSDVFEPATPLEALVQRGDYEGTLEHLRPMTTAERQRHRASIMRMIRLMWESGWKKAGDKGLIWGVRSTAEQDRAAAAAILLCGTAKDAAEARLQAADIVDLSREFELPCLPTLAEALVERAGFHIKLVQELIVAGVVTRPEGEGYTIGLISLPRIRDRNTTLADYFAADPGLNEAVLRMFDIQGTADDCLASSDKYNSVENSWTTQLLALSRNGVLARATLLDKSLSALEQDWPQFRAGWFSRFHQELAPTTAELRENAPRYLQLCYSRIPPTVSLALDALSQLESEGQVEPDTLLSALRPVLASGSKGQVETALKMLDRCVARAPGLGVEAALMACAALVSEAPALQAKVLKHVARQASDARVREELQRHLPGLAASNHAAAQKLLGHADVPAAVAVVAPAPEPLRRSVNPTDAERRLKPVRGRDELIQLIAYVFENDTDIDAFERALCALVMAAPIASGELAAFGPVLKRVPKLRKPVAVELGRLLVFACESTRPPVAVIRDGSGDPSRVHKQLISRTETLMELASQGKGVAPLSTPTHQRGVIAPAELIARLQAHREQGATTSLDEQVLAILRLDPVGSEADRRALRAMPDEPFVRALRYALGDDVVPGKQRELFCAAARIRHPRADDATLLLAYGDLGPDGPAAARYVWNVDTRHSGEKEVFAYHELFVRVAGQPIETSDLMAVTRHPPPTSKREWWARTQRYVAGTDPAVVAYWATLLPSDLEAFFAEGARELGNNIDWWEARWHNKAYLQPLLDATVRPGAMGLLMLACALGGKEPGQTALAVDGLVRLHADGRLDLGLLVETFGRLLATPLVKAARYRKSFDAALRIEPGLAGTLIDLLIPSLVANAESPPKEVAKLLELVHELLLSSGRSLSDGERTGLAGIKAGSSGKAIQKRLQAM